MTDPANFSEARERLDEIVKQVRSKDVSLEKSLDLFDEAIKMGNSCFEMIDRIDSGDMENMSVEREEGMSEDAAKASVDTANAEGDTAEGSDTEGETTVDQQSDESEPVEGEKQEDIDDAPSAEEDADEPTANVDANEE